MSGRDTRFAGRAFAVCAALLVAASAASAKDVNAISGKAWIVDGNVLIVHDQKLRLYGVDAPDRKQTCKSEKGGSYPCGLRAAFAMDALAKGKVVQCQPRGIGADRMVLATCSLAGLDLGGAMVEAGWATANTDIAPEYADSQGAAKTAKIGLWQGAFQPPAEWRAQHLSPAGTTPG